MELPFFGLGTEGGIGGDRVELVTEFLEFRCGRRTREDGGGGGYGCGFYVGGFSGGGLTGTGSGRVERVVARGC